MTSYYNVTYHLKGIEILGGNLNMHNGQIDGVTSINLGNWSIEVGSDGDLWISNDDVVQAKITNNNISINNNTIYQRFFMIQPCNIDDCIGLMVSNTNKFYNYDLSQTPNNEQSIPTIQLSEQAEDPKFMGIIINCEKYAREFVSGAFKTIYSQEDEVNRVLVSNFGVGSMWVCDINGSLSNGDYITTSNISGYGMKQNDDIKHSYTGPKITHDCSFNPEPIILQKPVDFDLNGPIYETMTTPDGNLITDVEYQKKYIYKDGSRASKNDFEQEIEKLMAGGKSRISALKSRKRTIFRACLVGYSF
jgi:hypothetical protein